MNRRRDGAPHRARFRLARLALVLVLVATVLRVASETSTSWATGASVTRPPAADGSALTRKAHAYLRRSGKLESPTRRVREKPEPTTGNVPEKPEPTTGNVPGSAPACQPGWRQAEPIARLASGLGEISGFVASPVHRSWGWGVRDSGNPASLYAIKPTVGGQVRTQELRAYGLDNSDWEDIAYTPGPEPGTGHLWVLENVGNGWTGNRWIYQFEEPDPENPPPAPAPLEPPPATLVSAYQWAYPDLGVNTETMFVFDGDLVVVTKTEPSRVYRFNGPLLPSIVNVPTYIGTLPAGKLLSIAALSVDQRTLAVSNHGKVDIYENRGDVGDLAALISNPVAHHDMVPDNREGGAFFPYGSCDLVLVAESKTLWQLPHR